MTEAEAEVRGTDMSSMEEEVEFLRQELRDKTVTMQRLQTTLFEQQARANVAVMNLRTQLRHKDREARQLKQEHEQRMKALLTHLLYLEGQMRLEQKQVLQALRRKEEGQTEKDDVIRRQRSAIEDLATKNDKLLTALKEAHGYSGGNGLLSSSLSSPGSPGNGMFATTPVVLRKSKLNGQSSKDKEKDKAQSKVRFGSVKDKLRRHRSSLELHRPASLETLLEGTLRYGSQENISSPGGSLSATTGIWADTRSGRGPSAKSGDGVSSDELKKTRLQERKERCKSLIDYPFRLNDLPEVSSEVEKGQFHAENGDEGFLSSLASSRNSDPTSISSSSLLSDPMYDQLRAGRSPSSSLSSSVSPQLLSSPHGRDSLYSDEDEAFFSSPPPPVRNGGGSGGSGSDVRDGSGKVKTYGELAKAASMPQALSAGAEHDGRESHLAGSGPVKERPHSLSGADLTLMDRMTMQPQVSMCPSPTGHDPPGGSESNPFKSFKNVFKRRNSKQRSKKRPVSMGQVPADQPQQQLQEHFRKYDLS